MYVARRLMRAGWPYVMRQGVANLYRPSNQTRSVVLSLGFGAFLVSTLYLLQTTLLTRFNVDAAASGGNVLFYDVQDDQGPWMDTIITRSGENTKIVLCGDVHQIDVTHMDAVSNGLSYVVEAFKDEEMAGHVTLLKGERSALATKAAELL